jgi:hypothetical protein
MIVQFVLWKTGKWVKNANNQSHISPAHSHRKLSFIRSRERADARNWLRQAATSFGIWPLAIAALCAQSIEFVKESCYCCPLLLF